MKLRQRLINPVLEKEIRLRMRTIRSPLAIMFYLIAIGVLAFGFMFMMVTGSGSRAINPEESRFLFYFLSGSQLVLISFMIPGLTAGVISGEREKQTLSMLLTTAQSSTTIILSKLLSSISFMLLIVFATMPIYSVVFLYGGISPGQLVNVFLYYIFVMLMLACFGVFFSTVFKKTMIAVVTTYSVVLFIFGFTALFYLFLEALTRSQSLLPGLIISINPMAVLLSIFDENITNFAFGPNRSIKMWHIFFPVYTLLSALALGLSIRYLRPVMRKPWS